MKVRIAVGINERGEWFAYGGDTCDDAICQREIGDNMEMDLPYSVYFVEAEVDPPKPITIRGQVVGTNA